MGVDCKVYLPDNVKIDNVVEVMGIAAGLPCKRFYHKSYNGKDTGYWGAHVEGASAKPCQFIVTLADIELKGKMVDGLEEHTVNYHFERDRTSGRLLMPRSTAFWLAIAHRLVDFFGGHIDYQDCDDSYNDYEVPAKSDELNSPDDGELWQNLQERIESVKPITQEELQHYNSLAAYNMGD